MLCSAAATECMRKVSGEAQAEAVTQFMVVQQEVYKGKDDNSIGPFTDKWLILSLVGSGRGKKEQGQVVVNLAHYAAVHNEARQGFTVAVTDKKITQSLGEVVLEVTIG